MDLPIYLDNNATTRMDPRVLEEMLPYFAEMYGNAASSSHTFGWAAKGAVDRAREQVASLIGAAAEEIVFTSGATESDNLALKGIAESYREKGNHIITQVTEHKAVLDCAERLQRHGFEVTYLPVDENGAVSAEQVAEATTDRTVLCSIMHANNEVGTIQPIREIGAVCRQNGVLFHTDAVQAIGKVPLNVEDDFIDLASLTAHKIYGPKGCGALYVRSQDPRVTLAQQIDGGGHEHGLRSGTLNVPGIVGFGKAVDICREEMDEDHRHADSLRNLLLERILGGLCGVFVNGHPTNRLPGNLNLSFAGTEGESLLVSLGGIALSSGSACTSSKVEGSYVVKALGRSDELARSCIRFGIGRFNTEEEIGYVAGRVVQAVRRLREMNPLWKPDELGEGDHPVKPPSQQ